jgi:hypothetical protein
MVVTISLFSHKRSIVSGGYAPAPEICSNVHKVSLLAILTITHKVKYKLVTVLN